MPETEKVIPIEEKRSQVLEELELIPDAYERLGHVVEVGKNSAGLPEDLRMDQFKIEGCMSQLWVVPEYRGGLCFYRSDSDSAIVKGIAALLCDFYSAQPAAVVASTNADFLGEVGITQHLSPNRRNGLSRITETIHRFAKACEAG